MAAPPAMTRSPHGNGRPSPFRRRLLATGLLATVLAWMAGLAWFTRDAMRPPARPPHVDGIVALTGGQGRIDESLRLLAQGDADRLLISGVDLHATLADFLRHQPQPTPLALWMRTTLGHSATSTLGNADETAAWVRAYHIRSLVVVTAGYHIRRAMMEIARTVPDVRLYGYPIQSPALQHLLHPATIRLMVTEYDKWLLACLDVARLTRPLHGLINHTDTRPGAPPVMG
ncbi:YdcF family protein [Komagataeibacter europaeus]|uniref:YdcF family protein n=1 Tax=Komagataeibacter europaeus TaxID=33995 RepID=UPI0003782E96|nr:YdcF family protein [Komagataeibacter europaeus]